MLSIIIPTLNEEKHIGKLLLELNQQLSKGDEIIIVDSHSKDKTEKIARKAGAKIIKQPKLGIGLAKTAGAKAAKNKILVFMDADCIPAKTFLEKIRFHFSNKKTEAVGGLDLYSSSSQLHELVYNIYSIGIFYGAKMIHFLTGKYWIPANNCVYRKETFFKVGGFRSVVCEDTDIMHRLPSSRNVIYDSELIVTLSDRRFRESGFLKTIFLWIWSDVAAFITEGVSTRGYRKD